MREANEFNDPVPYRGWQYDSEANYTTAPMANWANPLSPGLNPHALDADSGRHADPTIAFGDPGIFDPLHPPVQTPPQPITDRKRNRSVPRVLFLIPVFALILGLVAATVVGASSPFGQHFLHPAQNIPTGQAHRVATPDGQIIATPAPQTQLPAAWTASGLGPVEAGEAELMAQAFVERYQSIENHNPQSLNQSLTNAELFLSRNALARFLGRVPGTPADRHVTNTFTGTRQSAVGDAPPMLLSPQTVNGNFFALVVVPYQLSQTANGRTQTSQEQMTVALAPVAYGGGSVPQSMGWVVVAWQLGATAPQLPLQP